MKNDANNLLHLNLGVENHNVLNFLPDAFYRAKRQVSFNWTNESSRFHPESEQFLECWRGLPLARPTCLAPWIPVEVKAVNPLLLQPADAHILFQLYWILIFFLFCLFMCCGSSTHSTGGVKTTPLHHIYRNDGSNSISILQGPVLYIYLSLCFHPPPRDLVHTQDIKATRGLQAVCSLRHY